jgi:hypothetical protein
MDNKDAVASAIAEMLLEKGLFYGHCARESCKTAPNRVIPVGIRTAGLDVYRSLQ